MKLFFFDTETTWLDSDDQILQFWAIYWSFDGKEFHEEHRMNQYINVKKKSRPEAEKVHGISKKTVEKFWFLKDYIDEFLEYIDKSDYIIWHNLDFDVKMLEQECDRIGKGIDWWRKTLFCTMKSTTDIVRISDSKWWYKRPKLQELHKHLFWKYFEDAHDAMADIEATKNCFVELIKSGEVAYLKDWSDRNNESNLNEEQNNTTSDNSLVKASENWNIERVKELLDNWVDIEEEDENWDTALIKASKNWHIKVVRLLLKYWANIEKKGSKFHWRPALIWASRKWDNVIVKTLLEHWANIESCDEFWENALIWASKNWHTETVKLLLKNWANIEADWAHWRTALIWASFDWHKKTVELLLENWANIEAKGKLGWTALYYANYWEHEDVVKLLLKHWAKYDENKIEEDNQSF